MRLLKIGLVILMLVQSGCSSLSAPTSPTPADASPTPSPTATTLAPTPTTTTTPPPPTPTHTVVPSPTPEETVLDLEIVEWAEYPYANLADPANTDTHVEVLFRNPNPFPVRLIRDGIELKFLNAAGDVVYRNSAPFFYIWEGSWVMAGETAALSACVCFWTAGLEKQAWESLELVAPVEPFKDVAYTTEVNVTLGEFFSLEEAHLGGDMPAAELTLANTSGQALQSFEVRVIARDAGGRYVGVAISGAFVDRDDSGGYLAIEPGASAGGIVPSEIDYAEDPYALVYEVTAIGIPAN